MRFSYVHQNWKIFKITSISIYSQGRQTLGNNVGQFLSVSLRFAADFRSLPARQNLHCRRPFRLKFSGTGAFEAFSTLIPSRNRQSQQQASNFLKYWAIVARFCSPPQDIFLYGKPFLCCLLLPTSAVFLKQWKLSFLPLEFCLDRADTPVSGSSKREKPQILTNVQPWNSCVL